MRLRLRLFWKILFGFWFTFICIVEGVWVVFTLYNIPRFREEIRSYAHNLSETRLASAETALRLGGEDGLRVLLASWPEEERVRLTFAPVGADEGENWLGPNVSVLASMKVPGKVPGNVSGNVPGYIARIVKEEGKPERRIISRKVPLADGTIVRIIYDRTDMLPRPPKHGPLHIPVEMVVFGVVGGLLFSALLAWHLSRPIWRLRKGFTQLAGGNLDVRLKGLMGRRRDEIADLARDFDSMAERLQILVESREQMLYDVSHELRSPLARQHIAIGLARQNPRRTEALLDRIERESSRMDELVGELLTLSRVEAEESVLEEYFDLQGLARVVVDNTRFEAEKDGVSIQMHHVPEDELAEISTVRGDAELVRRALENVLRNAVRHSPPGSSVVVSVKVDAAMNSCAITVEDSGPGVPEESLKRIFEPFVRLRTAEGGATGKGTSQGAGLGLAIASRAIAVHKGRIYAANRSEGGGLSITMVLPLEGG